MKALIAVAALLSLSAFGSEARRATVTLATAASTHTATAGASLVLQCPGSTVRYEPGSSGAPPTATATSYQIDFTAPGNQAGHPIQLHPTEDRISILGVPGRICYVYTQTVPPVTSTSLVMCLTYRNTVVSVGTSPVAVPTTGLANRRYAKICVSTENAGAPKVKCDVDPAVNKPVMGLSEPGDVLQTGANPCEVYWVDTSHLIWCVSDTVATAVLAGECVAL